MGRRKRHIASPDLLEVSERVPKTSRGRTVGGEPAQAGSALPKKGKLWLGIATKSAAPETGKRLLERKRPPSFADRKISHRRPLTDIPDVELVAGH
jgi:hypothetical protein